MDQFINIANTLYLLSYFVRNILWLRMFTVVAASCLIPYFYYRPQPLLGAIYWNLFFIVLNGFWIVRLVLKKQSDRTPVAPSVELASTRADRITLAAPLLAHRVEFRHTRDTVSTHIRLERPVVQPQPQSIIVRSAGSRSLDTLPARRSL